MHGSSSCSNAKPHPVAIAFADTITNTITNTIADTTAKQRYVHVHMDNEMNAT